MQVRKLDQSGPDVSPIGVGAMSFTNFYGPTNEAGSRAILDAALDAGVTLLDTANVYGQGGTSRRSLLAPLQRLCAWRRPLSLVRADCGTLVPPGIGRNPQA